MTGAPPIPPRISWNENLARDFMKSHGVVSSFPPIHKQLESVVVNRHALHKFGYNPSIIQHKGRIFMAYRYHQNGSASTELAIAELNNKLEVKTNSKILFVPSARSTEDDRLFLYKDELYITYVESDWPARPNCIVKYALLIEGSPWKVADLRQPRIGKNDGTGMEKNWVFWQHENDLMCLYQSEPEQIIYNLTGGNAEHRSPGPRWPYGEIRGGCVIPHEGKLLRFFHSKITNELPPTPWRYFLGCCLMETAPPFKVISVSQSPLISASEICDLTEPERNSCSHYKQNVIFPAGVMAIKGGFLLSVGVNDSGCCLLKIKPEDLKL